MSLQFWSRKNRNPEDVQAAPGERPNRAAVSEAVDICTMAAQEYLSKILNGRSDAVDILNNRGSSAEEGWGGRSAPRPKASSIWMRLRLRRCSSATGRSWGWARE